MEGRRPGIEHRSSKTTGAPLVDCVYFEPREQEPSQSDRVTVPASCCIVL